MQGAFLRVMGVLLVLLTALAASCVPSPRPVDYAAATATLMAAQQDVEARSQKNQLEIQGTAAAVRAQETAWAIVAEQTRQAGEMRMSMTQTAMPPVAGVVANQARNNQWRNDLLTFGMGALVLALFVGVGIAYVLGQAEARKRDAAARTIQRDSATGLLLARETPDGKGVLNPERSAGAVTTYTNPQDWLLSLARAWAYYQAAKQNPQAKPWEIQSPALNDGMTAEQRLQLAESQGRANIAAALMRPENSGQVRRERDQLLRQSRQGLGLLVAGQQSPMQRTFVQAQDVPDAARLIAAQLNDALPEPASMALGEGTEDAVIIEPSDDEILSTIRRGDGDAQ